MRSRTIIRSICRDIKEKVCRSNPYEIDITEIDGFDNLHHATDMDKGSRGARSRLTIQKRCFFL